MSITDSVSYFLFISALIATPGPANMVLVAYGARRGFGAAWPVLIGLWSGFVLLMGLGGIGLLELLGAFPALQTALWFFSVGYVLYLSWRIYTAPTANLSAGGEPDKGKIGFFASFIIHPLNPKAWLMVISSYAQFYDPARGLSNVLAIVGISLCAALIWNSMWLFIGSFFFSQISDPKLRKRINAVLALLTVSIVIYLVAGEFVA